MISMRSNINYNEVMNMPIYVRKEMIKSAYNWFEKYINRENELAKIGGICPLLKGK